MNAASNMLKKKQMAELIDCLVNQPFSMSKSCTGYVPREEKYVNISLLKRSDLEEEFSNSDRETLMQQRHLELNGIQMESMFGRDDEMVIVRGIGGE